MTIKVDLVIAFHAELIGLSVENQWNRVTKALQASKICSDKGIRTHVVVLDIGSNSANWRRKEILYRDKGLNFFNDVSIFNLINTVPCRYLLYLTSKTNIYPTSIPVFYRAILQTSAASVFGPLFTSDSNIYNNEAINDQMLNRLHPAAIYNCDELRSLSRKNKFESVIFEMVLRNKLVTFLPVALGEIEDKYQHIHNPTELLSTFQQENLISKYSRFHPDTGSY